MKTLGQVLHEARLKTLGFGLSWIALDPESQYECEQEANAVLAHAIANAEPVLYVHPIYLKGNTLAVECSTVRLSDSQIALFTVPQPLPTVDEIAEAIFDADAVVWSWLEATNEQKEKYREKAKAVVALLKREK